MINVVIPVHNRKLFTRNCLVSLRKQSLTDFTIVVIDDGSTDGTEQMLENEAPDVHVIKGDGNLWWTKATNLGVKYSLERGATHILTLNNDTVAPTDFIEKMISWAEKKPTALLGAFAYDYATNQPVYGGEILNWKWAKSMPLLKLLGKDQWHGLHEVTHFPGRGLLIPAQVFNTVGLFDEKHFPHYIADYDFTRRAIKAGFKVYCNYDAILYIYPNIGKKAEYKFKKSFKNYYHHLFSTTGGGNLKVFILFALLNCPIKYMLFYIPIGLTRRIAGYLRDWLHELS